jgi:hypothetical protein
LIDFSFFFPSLLGFLFSRGCAFLSFLVDGDRQMLTPSPNPLLLLKAIFRFTSGVKPLAKLSPWTMNEISFSIFIFIVWGLDLEGFVRSFFPAGGF